MRHGNVKCLTLSTLTFTQEISKPHSGAYNTTRLTQYSTENKACCKTHTTKHLNVTSLYLFSNSIRSCSNSAECFASSSVRLSCMPASSLSRKHSSFSFNSDSRRSFAALRLRSACTQFLGNLTFFHTQIHHTNKSTTILTNQESYLHHLIYNRILITFCFISHFWTLYSVFVLFTLWHFWFIAIYATKKLQYRTELILHIKK